MVRMTSNDLEAKRIDGRYRTIWWFMAFAFFAFCFQVAAKAYVELKNDPPWLKLATTIVSLVIYLAGPIGMYIHATHRHQKFIADFADRLGRIEQVIDASRTTSGLKVDGGDPPPGSPS